MLNNLTIAEADEMADPDRRDIALHAAWEIHGAAGLVLGEMEVCAANLPLLTLLKRIRTLADIQTSALSDPLEPTQAIRERADLH